MTSDSNSDSDVYVIQADLPVTAVQALYHAATGKTENLGRSYTENFIVRWSDIAQLNARVMQQIQHYELISPPTITIKVNFSNQESQLYSSWERFAIFDANRSEIISDIVFKYEFLLKLPSVDKPQRYIMNIDVDSKLPMIIEPRETPLGFSFSNLSRFPSLILSIDYIDYILARNFLKVVEDWHHSLRKSKDPKLIGLMRKARIRWSAIFLLLSRLGLFAFVFVFAIVSSNQVYTAKKLTYLVSLFVLLWALGDFVFSQINSLFLERLRNSLLPAVILITDGDKRAFEVAEKKCQNLVPAFIRYSIAMIMALLLNVVASFIYARMTKN